MKTNIKDNLNIRETYQSRKKKLKLLMEEVARRIQLENSFQLLLKKKFMFEKNKGKSKKGSRDRTTIY